MTDNSTPPNNKLTLNVEITADLFDDATRAKLRVSLERLIAVIDHVAEGWSREQLLEDPRLVELAHTKIQRGYTEGRKRLLDTNEVKDYVLLKVLSDPDARRRESFGTIFLDHNYEIIGEEVLFQGTLDKTAVHPRDVLVATLKARANGVILYHNHPSGGATPSEADKIITQNLEDALSIINVHVVDHVIVGADRGETTSLQERGEILDPKGKYRSR